MIKIENAEIYGWEAAIRGMRNSWNSWGKSDSKFNVSSSPTGIWLGANDKKLMESLVKSGSDHSKFMRMITVTCDITAPLYWWKQASTYKVGVVVSSCSTMHKIQSKEFTLDDFSVENLPQDVINYPFMGILECLNFFRTLYNQDHDKDDWWVMIQLLPSSYNQRRTVQLNYEVLRNIYHARKKHKFDEWRDFCEWIEKLPYSEIITEC